MPVVEEKVGKLIEDLRGGGCIGFAASRGARKRDGRKEIDGRLELATARITSSNVATSEYFRLDWSTSPHSTQEKNVGLFRASRLNTLVAM